jgi:hypothetical protein
LASENFYIAKREMKFDLFALLTINGESYEPRLIERAAFSILTDENENAAMKSVRNFLRTGVNLAQKDAWFIAMVACQIF